MSTVVQAPLTQGAGYGVVVGLGVAFALGMVWVTRVMKKSFNEDNNSTETFMVANRSVGTGLTAAAVISSWLYSSALLGASLLTYRYGLALGVWWGASASTMICLMAYLAIQAKRRAPNAHTLLEIIKVRYGRSAHILWIFLALLNNCFVFASMLVGASTAVSSLTGMNVVASTYLLPLGVAVYTYFGGLRATFLTDYVHTFIIMIILVWFTIKVIVVKEIGSIGALYDAVVVAGRENPVEGNHDGSYLTMRSEQCLYFGILHVISNFGVVIMDTGFWQKGFSADVAAAVPGYVLGGIASFSVPWCFGTIVGLAGLALEGTAAWPTYPRKMTAEEVSGGLVLPYVAQAVAGKAGAGAILLTIFMSCTSIASAQMIATSSIISFDIYGTRGGLLAVHLDACNGFPRGRRGHDMVFVHVGEHHLPRSVPYLFRSLVEKANQGRGHHLAHRGNGVRTVSMVRDCVPLLRRDHGGIHWRNVAVSVRMCDLVRRSPACDRGCSPNMAGRPIHEEDEPLGSVLGGPHHHGACASLASADVRCENDLFQDAWVVISLIWLWFTLLVANFYPLIDGGLKQILIVIQGKRGVKGSTELPPDSESSSPPPEQVTVVSEKTT
ncbi:urea active transporter-like protein, partial [Aureobasidium melanogenum]